MKYIYIAMLLCLCSLASAQPRNEYGEKFQFDAKSEKDPHFIFNDNYNNYLLTVLDAPGMLSAGHQVIVRKFDQKNNLVDTYKTDIPAIDASAMYKYLGFAESRNGKAAAFVEVHSGKAGKSEIYKIEFDKSSAKFTNTLLATNPIISLMKSGDCYLEKSENGQYIAISYHSYRDKGTPDKSTLILVDAGSLNIVWQKDLSFDNEYTSQNFTVTNSGKVVIVRDMKGSKKGITYLTIVSAVGQEDKNFESPIFLNEMKAVSIGTEDYIVAFNSNSKNFREDFFNSLLLYDLKAGRILNNTKITEFAAVKNLEDVSIAKIILQNNEICIFTEAKTNIPLNSARAFASATSFERKLNFGPAFLHVLSFDGQLKTAKQLYVEPNAPADLYHSFGLVNIKGVNYINTGNYTGVYPLSNGTYEKGPSKINFYQGDPYGNVGNKFINQLVSYFPDKNSLVFGRVITNTEMSLVSVFDVN
jgi:hypothetical protein